MKADSNSPWKWNRAIKNNFYTNNDDTNKFSLPNIFDSNRRNANEPTALVLESGGGAGVGCGVGLGFGLVGGIGHGGASSWNHLHLVFGLGLGCGVGLGIGIGQGIGYGISFDSYFSDSHHKSNPKHNKPSLIQI